MSAWIPIASREMRDRFPLQIRNFRRQTERRALASWAKIVSGGCKSPVSRDFMSKRGVIYARHASYEDIADGFRQLEWGLHKGLSLLRRPATEAWTDYVHGNGLILEGAVSENSTSIQTVLLVHRKFGEISC